MVRDPELTAAAMAVLAATRNGRLMHQEDEHDLPYTPEEVEALEHLAVAVSERNQGFHVAVCLDCRPLLPLPFVSHEALDVWREGHTKATEHRVIGDGINEPVRRAGLSLDPSQMQAIRSLLDSGDLLGAQKAILREVEKQRG